MRYNRRFVSIGEEFRVSDRFTAGSDDEIFTIRLLSELADERAARVGSSTEEAWRGLGEHLEVGYLFEDGQSVELAAALVDMDPRLVGVEGLSPAARARLEDWARDRGLAFRSSD